VDERGNSVHFHSLSERKFTHHHVHLVGNFQQLGQTADDFVETITIDS